MEETTRQDGVAAASEGRSLQDRPAQDRPVGDLARQLPEQVSRLVRDELRLARMEMTEKGKRAGLGAGMFGGSGVVALYGTAAILAAVILLLAKVVPAWGAALIVGGALMAFSATLALLGRRQIRAATPPVPEQAVTSVKSDVEEIKERAHR